jgi:hypothetical protein
MNDLKGFAAREAGDAPVRRPAVFALDTIKTQLAIAPAGAKLIYAVPADDLAALVAEVERLREALRDIQWGCKCCGSGSRFEELCDPCRTVAETIGRGE